MNTTITTRTIWRVLLCTIILILLSNSTEMASAKEPLLAELLRLQRSTGLTLVSIQMNLIGMISFENRELRTTELAGGFAAAGAIDGAISPDGSLIAHAALSEERDRNSSANGQKFLDSYLVLVRMPVVEGSLIKYPDLRNPEEFCWSGNAELLAFRGKTLDKVSEKVVEGLFVLDIATHEIRLVSPTGHLSTSCWSPEADRLVYDSGNEVRLFNTREADSKFVDKGSRSGWSPDGNWISYADGDSYWLTSSKTSEKKLLLKNKHAFGDLSWSPDSKFVAYLRRPGFFESIGAMMEEHRLIVRRVDDGKEACVYKYEGKSGSTRWSWARRVFSP